MGELGPLDVERNRVELGGAGRHAVGWNEVECGVGVDEARHQHHHPVLHEENEALRPVRRVAFAVFRRALGALAARLGVPEPERM